MNANDPTNTSWYLGLDFSTQRLKATTVDASGAVIREDAVEFDSDLPDHKTSGGVHRHADGLTVTSPTLMWVSALDLLFAKMSASDYQFGRIAAVSGSGQQHGSVYWRKGAASLLAGLVSGRSLAEQLADAFSIADSPVWMDSSTSRQCRIRSRYVR